jgi:hypothetical protein
MMLQNIEVEEEADDRKLYFNESSGIYYINKDTDIKCCQRAHAKSNECSFSICPSCFSKQVSPKRMNLEREEVKDSKAEMRPISCRQCHTSDKNGKGVPP